MISGGDGDRSRIDKCLKSIIKKESKRPIQYDDIPGWLLYQPQMYTSSLGQSYVPYGTGNPIDCYGLKVQSLPRYTSTSHTRWGREGIKVSEVEVCRGKNCFLRP